MKKNLLYAINLGACLLLWPALLSGAEVAKDRPFVHPLFSDHMVLQRGCALPVWGWAECGSKVSVSFAGQSKSAIAGPDGKWMVRLKAMRASSAPAIMSITGPQNQTVSISDVLVGDVWLCSGQSNMEMGMSACEATEDIATGNFPLIRLLTVPRRVEKLPVDTAEVRWSQCSSEALKQGVYGGFSAASFYFGRQLYRELGVPIGLIHSSWGGTVAEAWTSREALEKMESMKDRLAALSSPPQPAAPANPNITTVLYNGMIAPLLPFAIKGAIWYQGESNAGRAYQYRELLPTMIGDWRKRFGVGDFPFYIVQLAAFTERQPEPRQNDWAELREAQSLTAKNLNHCGLAVAIDIGDAKDIHPKNKRDVGIRLALNALAKDYGKKVEYSGPWYRTMKAKEGVIQLNFDHAKSGLVAKGVALKGFAIAGEDKKFVWADAHIKGKSVLVSSPHIPKPVAVRYAWDGNPDCNLYNGAGLPAVPFRTDDWPGITQGRR